MIGKFTLKDVKKITEYTLDQLKGTQVANYPNRQVGYAKKSQANWCYSISVIEFNGCLHTVVDCFGIIQ